MKNMVSLVLLLLLGCVASRPAKYDQRQDGEWNVHAHLENIVVVYVSKGSSLGINLLELAAKKKAAAKADSPGNDIVSSSVGWGRGGADVIIADTPYGIEVDLSTSGKKTATADEASQTETAGGVEPQTSSDSQDDKDATIPPGETSSTTPRVEPSPDEKRPNKESSASTSEKESAEDDSSKEQSSSEDSKEKSSEGEKSSEESDSDEKSSEEKNSSEKSSEESSSGEAPKEKEESEKKPKEARVLGRADDKGAAKLKQILADGVEPCVEVSNQGLCQTVTRAANQRIERQQRQRLIDILSSGISPAI